jgi:NADH dehydrogenase FAD-containing subunit
VPCWPRDAENGEYELTVVSPRSYFLYTPLLPSAAAGSVQERSIVEPVRNLLKGQVGRASRLASLMPRGMQRDRSIPAGRGHS